MAKNEQVAKPGLKPQPANALTTATSTCGKRKTGANRVTT